MMIEDAKLQKARVGIENAVAKLFGVAGLLKVRAAGDDVVLAMEEVDGVEAIIRDCGCDIFAELDELGVRSEP
jgi:hypothetical protein